MSAAEYTSMRGRVVDFQGKPVTGARLRACPRDWANRVSVGSGSRHGRRRQSPDRPAGAAESSRHSSTSLREPIAAQALAFQMPAADTGGMLPDSERYRLLNGLYRSPKCRIGGWLKCRLRGRVKVMAISDGRVQWPMTRRAGGGAPTLILCGDLVASRGRHTWRRCCGTGSRDASTRPRPAGKCAKPPHAKAGISGTVGVSPKPKTRFWAR
jgi:hypothetical protein